LDEFIKLYIDLSKEKNSLIDSVVRTQLNSYRKEIDLTEKQINLAQKLNASYRTTDSLSLFKHYYQYAQNIYGVDLETEKTSTGYVISQRGISRADTAAILYKVLKPKMKAGEKGRFVLDMKGLTFTIEFQ